MLSLRHVRKPFVLNRIWFMNSHIQGQRNLESEVIDRTWWKRCTARSFHTEIVVNRWKRSTSTVFTLHNEKTPSPGTRASASRRRDRSLARSALAPNPPNKAESPPHATQPTHTCSTRSIQARAQPRRQEPCRGATRQNGRKRRARLSRCVVRAVWHRTSSSSHQIRGQPNSFNLISNKSWAR